MKIFYPESYIDSGAKSGLELRSAHTYPRYTLVQCLTGAMKLAAFAGSLWGQQELAHIHVLSAVLIWDTPQSPNLILRVHELPAIWW